MADKQAGNTDPRAVVLWPQGAPRSSVAGGAGGLELVFVPSPYEAAAELIAAPALALVMDLRLMGQRHLRLLRIARERRVELLAVGAVPAGLTAEDLSGTRLIARADLKAAMEGLLNDRQGRYVPSEEESQPAAPPEAEGPSPAASRIASPTKAHSPEVPSPEPASPQAASPSAGASGEFISSTAPPAPESPSQPPAGSLRSLLTADELAALLEDKP